MKFKKQIFGFMDMLRFKKLVPNRQKALDNGPNTPLPTTYRTNELAKRLHPGYMQVELIEINPLNDRIKEFVFKRVDQEAFPFFQAGQYVALQAHVNNGLISRPYSIVSSPKDALNNRLVLAIEKAGYFSNYMHDEAKLHDTFMMSEPSGEFHYESLKDQQHIIAIAGGSGITPFISMAKSMIEKSEKFTMTLFYGASDEKHLAYKEQLDNYAKQGLKVIYVLSDEKKEGYEHGFITKEILDKYADVRNSSIFMCGPSKMYDFVLKELASYDLPLKAIHKDATCCQDLDIKDPKTFKLCVHMRDQVYEIPALENETILVAMERAGINAPNKCRAGGCGFCHSKWIKGEYIVAKDRDGRREADIKFGFIHPCVCYPKSDLEIEVPPAY
ncbi:MAG: FAD-binding oxidoreductase [Erysipelotrichaceae bacterium]|nr:FAD-binding oxidoreductase [Erysipelotrichaceae bacterium]